MRPASSLACSVQFKCEHRGVRFIPRDNRRPIGDHQPGLQRRDGGSTVRENHHRSPAEKASRQAVSTRVDTLGTLSWEGRATAKLAVAMALVLTWSAAAHAETPVRAPQGPLLHPEFEVRGNTGPSLTGNGNGWGYGGGVSRRWDSLSLGLWMDHDRFDVEYLTDDVAMTFVALSGRLYPAAGSLWDPYLRLDVGGVLNDQCSGVGAQIGAGLDVYVLDFLKLGPSISLFAYGGPCGMASDVARTSDTRRWLSVRLDIVFAPRRRGEPPVGPFRP